MNRFEFDRAKIENKTFEQIIIWVKKDILKSFTSE
jgi:hypothetical protein